MKPVSLTIVQGTPFRYLVRLQQRNELGDLEPMNLAGYVIRLQARPKVQSSRLLLNLSSESGSITIDEVNGTFTIALTAEETSALDWGIDRSGPQAFYHGPRLHAVYHCEVTPPNGETFRVLVGKMTLDPEVVR